MYLIMRTGFLLLFILFFLQNNLIAQIQHALGMPDYYTLYSGYENKVLLASNNGKVINPRCNKAEIIDGKYLEYIQKDTIMESKETTCFLIKPDVSNENIVVKFDVIDEKGKLVGQDSTMFFVRRFPQPVVKVNTISKSMGQIITVGLPGDSPLIAPNFVVKNVELLLGDNNPTFSTNIPGSAVQKLKVNQEIGISVVLLNPITKSTEVTSATLRITE
jgi:hypothetical protein